MVFSYTGKSSQMIQLYMFSIIKKVSHAQDVCQRVNQNDGWIKNNFLSRLLVEFFHATIFRAMNFSAANKRDKPWRTLSNLTVQGIVIYVENQ